MSLKSTCLVATLSCLILTGCSHTVSTDEQNASHISEQSTEFNFDAYLESLETVPVFEGQRVVYPESEWISYEELTPAENDLAGLLLFELKFDDDALHRYYNRTPFFLNIDFPSGNTFSTHPYGCGIWNSDYNDFSLSLDCLSFSPNYSTRLASGTVIAVEDSNDYCYVTYSFDTDILIDSNHPVVVESLWVKDNKVLGEQISCSIGGLGAVSGITVTNKNCIIRGKFSKPVGSILPVIGDTVDVLLSPADIYLPTDKQSAVKVYKIDDGLLVYNSGDFKEDVAKISSTDNCISRTYFCALAPHTWQMLPAKTLLEDTVLCSYKTTWDSDIEFTSYLSGEELNDKITYKDNGRIEFNDIDVEFVVYETNTGDIKISDSYALYKDEVKQIYRAYLDHIY